MLAELTTITSGHICDSRGRRFCFEGHLSDEEVVEGVNALVHAARADGRPTWMDREISLEEAQYAQRATQSGEAVTIFSW